MLKTYTGERVCPKDIIRVNVSYKEKIKAFGPIYIKEWRPS